MPRTLSLLRPVLPILVTISLLWTAWDPTYSTFRRAQLQGRDVRVKGKQVYIVSLSLWATHSGSLCILLVIANDGLVPSTLHIDSVNYQALQIPF